MSDPSILLVEDSPADDLVVREALRRISEPLRVQSVGDGQAAIDYLSGKGPYKDRERFPMPDLILLDLSLPVHDGFYVLEWVRTEPALRRVPVIILATSSSSPDIQRAYAFGANSFITKPSDLIKLVRDLRLALDHWLYGRALPAQQPKTQQREGSEFIEAA